MNITKHIRKLGLLLALIIPSLSFSQTLKPTVPTPFAEKGFAIIGLSTVASATVATAGSGYTTLPTVAFTGGSGSTQATGTSTLKVVAVSAVSAGGSGYTVGDVLSVTGGTKTTTATLTVATVSSGAITGVTISAAGVYTVLPANNVAVTGGTGTGATFTLGWGVAGITVATGGSGYLTAPSVAFSGGGGSGAGSVTVTLAGSTSANAVQFRSYRAMTDTVISAITFPATMQGSGSYTGDSQIIGKTIPAGQEVYISGNSITLASGWGILTRRSAP